MGKPLTEREATLAVQRDQPVVANPLIENGREVAHFAAETEITARTRIDRRCRHADRCDGPKAVRFPAMPGLTCSCAALGRHEIGPYRFRRARSP